MDELQRLEPSSLGRFLQRWYGAHPESPAPAEEDLPWALRDWYSLAGDRSRAWSRYYNLLSRPELATEPEVVSFCSLPHDGDFWWAFERGQDDPPTLESEDRVSWLPTGHPLSELLLYIAVSSAVFVADHGLVNMTSDRANYDQVLAELTPLDPAIWAWPDSNLRFYYADGVLAQAGHMDGDYGYQVILGAVSDEKLSLFDARRWEWDSRA